MQTTKKVKWDYVSLFSSIPNPEDSAVVWGAKDDASTRALIDFLLVQQKKGNPPDFKWASAIQRFDGAVIATASTMLNGGLFWSIDHDAAAGGSWWSDFCDRLDKPSDTCTRFKYYIT